MDPGGGVPRATVRQRPCGSKALNKQHLRQAGLIFKKNALQPLKIDINPLEQHLNRVIAGGAHPRGGAAAPQAKEADIASPARVRGATGRCIRPLPDVVSHMDHRVGAWGARHGRGDAAAAGDEPLVDTSTQKDSAEGIHTRANAGTLRR